MKSKGERKRMENKTTEKNEQTELQALFANYLAINAEELYKAIADFIVIDHVRAYTVRETIKSAVDESGYNKGFNGYGTVTSLTVPNRDLTKEADCLDWTNSDTGEQITAKLKFETSTSGEIENIFINAIKLNVTTGKQTGSGKIHLGEHEQKKIKGLYVQESDAREIFDDLIKLIPRKIFEYEKSDAPKIRDLNSNDKLRALEKWTLKAINKTTLDDIFIFKNHLLSACDEMYYNGAEDLKGKLSDEIQIIKYFILDFLPLVAVDYIAQDLKRHKQKLKNRPDIKDAPKRDFRLINQIQLNIHNRALEKHTALSAEYDNEKSGLESDGKIQQVHIRLIAGIEPEKNELETVFKTAEKSLTNDFLKGLRNVEKPIMTLDNAKQTIIKTPQLDNIEGLTITVLSGNKKKKIDPQNISLFFNQLDDGTTLEPFDFVVLDAVYSFYDENKLEFTSKQLAQLIHHGGDPKAKVTQKQEDEIIKSILKMCEIIIYFRWQDNKALNALNATGLRMRRRLIPIDPKDDIKILDKPKGGKTYLFKINKKPPLYEYAKAINQIATYNKKLLSVPVNASKETTSIKAYLIRRIEQMTHQEKHGIKTENFYKIELSSIWLNALQKNDDEITRKKKYSLLHNTIIPILEDYKEKEYIKDFKLTKKGKAQAYHAIEIKL